MADTPEGVLRCKKCKWQHGVDVFAAGANAFTALKRHWQREHAPPKVRIEKHIGGRWATVTSGSHDMLTVAFGTLAAKAQGPTAAEVARWWATQAGYEVEE